MTEQEETPLALVPDQPSASGELTIVQVARAMVASKYFATTQSVAQAIVKMLAGKELGIPPVASMQGVYIVQGRVALSANLIAALIKKSGRYDYRVKSLEPRACEIEFYQQNASGAFEPIGLSSFTFEDARTAGLLRPNTPWQTYPRNMLFARALTNGARWYTPDVFNGGVFTPEELGSPPEERMTETVEPLIPQEEASA